MLGLELEHLAHDRTPPQAHDDAAADCTPALTRGLAGHLHTVAEAARAVAPIWLRSYAVAEPM
jgi:hypothetical protein